MPGVASLQAQAYYAHPRNGFWPIMADFLGQPASAWPADFAQRYECLLAARIGLWDVLAQAIRPGSLDANIRNDSVKFNAFNELFDDFQHISHIALNGQAAARWFQRTAWPTLSLAQQQRLSCHVLPSTSPAHAAMSLTEKSRHWQAVLRLSTLQT